MLSKRTLIIICIGFIVAAGIITLIVARTTTQTSEVKPANSITDRDTNTIVRTGTTGSTENKGVSPVVIFGTDKFREEKVTNTQIRAITSAIQSYSATVLKEKYASLTLRPQDFKRSDKSVTTTLRLGQTDAIIPVTIKLYDNESAVKVFIDDTTGQNNGNFLSIGNLPYSDALITLSAESSSPKSIDDKITINVTASEGYRGLVMKKLSEFGYDPTEFTYHFENYKDPFSS